MGLYAGVISAPNLFLTQAPENSSELEAMETCPSLTQGVLRIHRSPHSSENLGNSGTFLNCPHTWELSSPFSLLAISESAESARVLFLRPHPKSQDLGVLSTFTPSPRCVSLVVHMLVFYIRLQNLRQYLRGSAGGGETDPGVYSAQSKMLAGP